MLGMKLNKLSERDRKILEVLIQSNQKSTKKILSQFLGKHYSRILETDDYIVAEGDIPIALVAHMDTVFENSVGDRQMLYDEKFNIAFCPDGAGFDDKAGIFAILTLIREGFKPHIIFTTDEEMGAIGASLLAKLDCPFSECKYIIQLDRRGSNDCVFYDCDNPEFTKYVESFGFSEAIGSFTDITELCPKWKVAGVNLSVGYKEEHTKQERLYVTPMWATFDKVKKMLTEADNEIKNMKVRYATGKIDEDIYEVAIREMQNRKDVLTLELEKCNDNLSNLEAQIPVVIATACKLGTLWHDGNLETKRKIQNLVYPNGIYWDKAKRCYRTQNRNKFFDILDRYSISYGKEKGTSSDEDVPLCGRRESNPYASRHQILSLACLPISTRPRQYLTASLSERTAKVL